MTTRDNMPGGDAGIPPTPNSDTCSVLGHLQQLYVQTFRYTYSTAAVCQT